MCSIGLLAGRGVLGVRSRSMSGGPYSSASSAPPVGWSIGPYSSCQTRQAAYAHHVRPERRNPARTNQQGLEVTGSS